jgi:P4 family phage/plasmid primase-like protien
MIQIPDKLKKRGIKFVLLEKQGKKPFQQEWQNKVIEFDNSELLNHNGNYGVMGGGSNQLLIIDFDNEKVQNEVIKKLPDTFTVKTGRGMLHKYFFSDNTHSFKVFDEEMNTIADVQGEGKQVVGAGSIHPNGNKYEIVEDKEITFLPYAEIKALLMPYDKKPKKEISEIEKPKNNEVEDNFIDRVRNYNSISSVLSSFGIDISKNPTSCPFHSSKGGKCLGFNKDTAHCFHCDGSWNVFSLVKDIKKCDFKEALEYLSNLAGLGDELEINRRKFVEKLRENNRNEEKEVFNEFIELIAGKEKKWGEATEILINWILKHNYIYTIRDDVKTEMWIYKDGIYISQGKSIVKELLRKLLGSFYSQYIYNLVINKLEPDTFIDIDEFFFQNNIDEISVLNGILNINTRELKPFSPEKIFFNKLLVDYNSLAKCPMIDKFLSDVLSNQDDKLVFYEMGGFALLREYKYEKAFMLVGNGRNGKDKTLELLKRIFSVENCCSVPLSSLVPDSFIISEFFGKLINIAGEVNNTDLKDTTMFKALTGRSLVSGQRKYLQPITFQNYAKFVFACNELPMVYDNSKGFWDRWVLLEFPYTFLSQEEINIAKDKTYLKLRDIEIIDKIAVPNELSGLLNKFLDGLDRLKIQKDFSSTIGSEEIKTHWIRKANSFMAFCMDYIEDDYNGMITKKELRKRYSEYHKKHKLKGTSDKNIKAVLEEMYGASEERIQREELFGNDRLFVWTGIKWKNTKKS